MMPPSVQETGYYCGPACAQMVLQSLRAGLYSQSSLYALGRQLHQHPAWFTSPKALSLVLTRLRRSARKPAPAGGFKDYADFHVATTGEAMNLVAGSLENGQACAAAVFGGAHYVAVHGASMNCLDNGSRLLLTVTMTDPARSLSRSQAFRRMRFVQAREWLGSYLTPVRFGGPWHGTRTVIAARTSAANTQLLTPQIVRGARLTKQQFIIALPQLTSFYINNIISAEYLPVGLSMEVFGNPTGVDDEDSMVIVDCPGSSEGEYVLYSKPFLVGPLGTAPSLYMGLRTGNHMANILSGPGSPAEIPLPAEASITFQPLFLEGSPMLIRDPEELKRKVLLRGMNLPPFWRNLLRNTATNGQVHVRDNAYWVPCEESRTPYQPFRVIHFEHRKLYVRDDWYVTETLTPIAS